MVISKTLKNIFRFLLTYIQLQLHSFHMKKEKMSNTFIFFSLFVVLIDCWPVHLRFKSVEYICRRCCCFLQSVYQMLYSYIILEYIIFWAKKIVWNLSECSKYPMFMKSTLVQRWGRCCLVSLSLCFSTFLSINLYWSKAVMWPNSLQA